MFKSKSFTLVKNKFRYADMSWAKFFVIPGLAAFALLLVLSNVKHPDYYKKRNTTFYEHSIKMPSAEPLTINCTQRFKCKITCSDGDIEKINQQLENILINATCNGITLIINNSQFPAGAIQKNWINLNITINELRILLSSFDTIEPGAFESSEFNFTKILLLSDTNLKSFDPEMLRGLNNLQIFMLSTLNEDFTLKSNYLKYINSTLYRLSIQVNNSLPARNPQELLGNETLPIIQDVNLSGNNFGDLIRKDSFNVIRKVRNLYLYNCGISALETGVFDSLIGTINLIDLKNNALKTLPSDFFIHLLEIPLSRIYLSGNPWDCSCHLNSFVTVYKEKLRYFEDDLTCKTPEDFSGQNLKEPDLCSEVSPTVPSISTTIESTSPEIVKVHCSAKSKENYLTIKSADIAFTVETISSTSVRIKVTRSKDQFYYVLWFSNGSTKFESMEVNYNDYDLGCRARIERENIIGELEEGVTYAICLIRIGDVQISPFNCHSHYMPKYLEIEQGDDDDEEWFFWGTLPGTIAFIIVGILLGAFVGGISAFFIISWKPTLLKRSKRVIIINKSAPDVLVFPKNSSSTSLSTSNNASIINHRKSLKRAGSEGSISMQSNYYSKLRNQYEIVQYYQRMYDSNKIYFDHIPEDPAPTLPKNFSDSSTIALDEVDYGYGERYRYLKPVCIP